MNRSLPVELTMPLSFLDNDLYKFALQQAVLARYPEASAEYRFIDRETSRRYPGELVEALRRNIAEMDGLGPTEAELRWIGRQGWFSPAYLNYLARYRYRSEQVSIEHTAEDRLDLAVRGSWIETMLWEVPILAALTESYYQLVDADWIEDYEEFYVNTLDKGVRLSGSGCAFGEFGTRRRRNATYQELALRALRRIGEIDVDVAENTFRGTSNLHFARHLDIPCLGTMPHEWIMAHSVLSGLRTANLKALEIWREVFGELFSVALTDTYSLDLFFLNFDSRLARGYAAVRHDSGDPFDFADDLVSYYQENGIDPTTKTLEFSDSLSVERIQAIEAYVGKRTRTFYGIGTNLTNDAGGAGNPSIIVKLTALNGHPVVKTTADRDKATGDPSVIDEVMVEIRQVHDLMENSNNPFEDLKE